MMTTIKSNDSGLINGYLKYFYDIPTVCPYAVGDMAVYRQAQFGFVDELLMTAFIEAGFRRNGNSIYTMACPACGECRPIRLPVKEFKANRSQRRIIKKNQDITISTTPFAVTYEKINLLNTFFAHRFSGRDNTAESYYGTFFANTITETFEVEYRLGKELVGVAVVDIGNSWLNAVYFFFDSRRSHRHLGIFNILNMIDLCRRHDIDYLYLGYLIEPLSSMNYKAQFRPHQLLVNNAWQQP
ncbi:MAG: arginyltransferase [Desulfobulbaceae bacterium]|nr:MAG: arginyltransferase [Desulfobulbaceae bacterium]